MEMLLAEVHAVQQYLFGSTTNEIKSIIKRLLLIGTNLYTNQKQQQQQKSKNSFKGNNFSLIANFVHISQKGMIRFLLCFIVLQ